MNKKNTFITKRVDPFCDLSITMSTVCTIIITALTDDKIRVESNILFIDKLFNENKEIAYSVVIGWLTMAALIKYAIKINYDITFSDKTNNIYSKKNHTWYIIALNVIALFTIFAIIYLFYKGIMQTYSLYVLFSFSIITMFFFWITIFDAIVSQKMLEPFIFIIFVPLILLTIMANCKKGFALILLGFLIDQIISFIISLIISIKKLNKKIFKNNIKPRYILYLLIDIVLVVFFIIFFISCIWLGVVILGWLT